MKERFVEIFKSNIKRPGADKLLAWLERSDFFEAPASTRFHLSEPGGLLTHSVHVYERLREAYKNEKDRDTSEPVYLSEEEEETIAICGLLHDVCKIGTYKLEPKNQKTYDQEKVQAAHKKQVKHDSVGDYIWETVMGYKFDDDLPYGHGEKSVYIISGFMRLSREEAMAIRWHMGPWPDGEKQNASKAFEMYKLAVLTHIADLQATYMDEVEEVNI